MRPFGFLEPDARRLKRISDREGLRSRGKGAHVGYPQILHQRTPIYLIDLLEDLPAISIDANNNVILGSATARILKRFKDDLWEPNALVKHQDQYFADVEVTVYNASETALQKHASSDDISPPWLAVQDMFGDLYVINPSTVGVIPFRNDSGAEAPAHAIMQVATSVEIDDVEHVTIVKPNHDWAASHLVNVGLAVASTAIGYGIWLDDSEWVQYDNAAAPAVGEEWGPENDSWKLVQGRAGYLITGRTETVDGALCVRARRIHQESVWFELYSALSPLASHTEAKRLDYALADTGARIEVHDPYTAPGMWRGAAGYRGRAVRATGATSGRPNYKIEWMETIARWIRFTLTAAWISGAAANTTVNHYHLQGKDPGSTVTLYDPLSLFTDSIPGCVGRAEWNDRDGQYEVVAAQRAVKRAYATLTSNMCGGTPAITGWTPINIGPHTYDPGAGTLNNSAGHYGKTGDTVWFERSNNSPTFTWEVRDVTKHVYEVILDFRIKSGGAYIEVQRINAALEVCETESWEDKITLTECDE